MSNKNLTVVELKQLCRDKGISGYSKLNKADLIKLCNKKSSKKASKPSKKASKPTKKTSKPSKKASKPSKKTSKPSNKKTDVKITIDDLKKEMKSNNLSSIKNMIKTILSEDQDYDLMIGSIIANNLPIIKWFCTNYSTSIIEPVLVHTKDLNIFLYMLNKYMRLPSDAQIPIDDIFLEIVSSATKNASDKIAIILEKSFIIKQKKKNNNPTTNDIFWKSDDTYDDAINLAKEYNTKILNFLEENRDRYEFNI